MKVGAIENTGNLARERLPETEVGSSLEATDGLSMVAGSRSVSLFLSRRLKPGPPLVPRRYILRGVFHICLYQFAS